MGVGLAEGGDDALAAAVAGAKVDEEDLVLAVVDDAAELLAAADEVAGGELALEDGELEVVAEAAHGLEDAAEALVVGDVVADEVGGAHFGNYRRGGPRELSARASGVTDAGLGRALPTALLYNAGGRVCEAD